MVDLSNKWINNPTFLAQAAHFFSAIAVVMTFTRLFNMTGGVIAGAVLISLAIVKEFWYDLKYEIPKQSIWDSVLDFVFYVVGVIVAVGILFLSK